MSERLFTKVVEDPIFGTVVQVVDADGIFAGYDPTSEQVRSALLVRDNEPNEKLVDDVKRSTALFNHCITHSAMWELMSDAGREQLTPVTEADRANDNVRRIRRDTPEGRLAQLNDMEMVK